MQAHYKLKRGNGQTTPIYRADGREIGEVNGDTFQKHIRGSKHFLREPRAIAFDVSVLRDAEHVGAVIVLVIDDETGCEYRANMRRLWRKGFAVRRGYGDQWAMRLTEFNRTDDDLDARPAQPALFNLSHLVR